MGMGTHINFNNLGSDDDNESKPLVSQSSLYFLTFDELQSTLGEPGKDLGSMNIDELLNNIWTADETQAIMAPSVPAIAQQQLPSGFVPGGGNDLPRQGSLTLLRTLSQKTVEDVWKNLKSEMDAAPDRKQTLGEMTLEDFLLRAGVVREDNGSQQNTNSSSGFYGNNNGASSGLASGFGQPNQNNTSFSGLGFKAGGTMQQKMPPTIFPKQANVTFAAPSVDGPVNNSSGFGGMGGGGVTVAATSPSAENNNKWSSPVPYVFGLGRRNNMGLEKIVERRQKRMIKNRESATRSRARKQAYTLELVAEIENLKQLNQDLQTKQTKQAEIMKTQKNELKELSKKRPRLAKTQCLRRTLSGPW